METMTCEGDSRKCINSIMAQKRLASFMQCKQQVGVQICSLWWQALWHAMQRCTHTGASTNASTACVCAGSRGRASTAHECLPPGAPSSARVVRENSRAPEVTEGLDLARRIWRAVGPAAHCKLVAVQAIAHHGERRAHLCLLVRQVLLRRLHVLGHALRCRAAQHAARIPYKLGNACSGSCRVGALVACAPVFVTSRDDSPGAVAGRSECTGSVRTTA